MSFDLGKLNIVKNIPKVNFTEYSGLFVAEPKFGKTTTASMYPNAVIVPFEDGAKAVVSNVLDGMYTFDDFVDFIDKLEDNREEIGNDLKTIVFDTVNKAYELCEPYTLKQLGKLDGKKYSKPSDVPHGQFYPARDKYFALQIDRLLNMGFLPLFISHSQVKTITPKEGQPYDIYSSTMPERLEKIIYPLVSYIIFGERVMVDDGFGGKVSKRVLKVKSSDMSTAGSRVRLNEDIIFDTEEEAMTKFQEAFKEQIQEKLIKAGITKDIDEVAKQQEAERDKKVKEYISKSKEPTNEEIVELIKSKVPTLQGVQQEKVLGLIAKLGITSLDEPDKVKHEDLMQVYELLK